MARTLCLAIRAARMSFAPEAAFLEVWRYKTSWARNLPVSSTTATLQPVRRPGSMPRTEIGPAGGGGGKLWGVVAGALEASGVGPVFHLAPVPPPLRGGGGPVPPPHNPRPHASRH